MTPYECVCIDIQRTENCRIVILYERAATEQKVHEKIRYNVCLLYSIYISGCGPLQYGFQVSACPPKSEPCNINTQCAAWGRKSRTTRPRLAMSAPVCRRANKEERPGRNKQYARSLIAHRRYVRRPVNIYKTSNRDKIHAAAGGRPRWKWERCQWQWQASSIMHVPGYWVSRQAMDDRR